MTQSRLAGLLALLLAVAGCARPPDYVMDREVGSIGLVRANKTVMFRMNTSGALFATAAAEVQGAIHSLGGDPGQIRAAITARPSTASRLREILIGSGLEPARITYSQASVSPREALVELVRFTIVPGGCGGYVPLSFSDNAEMTLGRCIQASNLGGMLADPGDLVAPPRLESGDGPTAETALQSQRSTNRAAPPLATGSGSGDYRNGAAGMAAPGTAPAATAAGDASPLLGPLPSN